MLMAFHVKRSRYKLPMTSAINHQRLLFHRGGQEDPGLSHRGDLSLVRQPHGASPSYHSLIFAKPWCSGKLSSSAPPPVYLSQHSKCVSLMRRLSERGKGALNHFDLNLCPFLEINVFLCFPIGFNREVLFSSAFPLLLSRNYCFPVVFIDFQWKSGFPLPFPLILKENACIPFVFH